MYLILSHLYDTCTYKDLLELRYSIVIIANTNALCASGLCIRVQCKSICVCVCVCVCVVLLSVGRRRREEATTERGSTTRRR
jgi:hypothetical protein